MNNNSSIKLITKDTSRVLTLVQGERSTEECLLLLLSKFIRKPTEVLSTEIVRTSIIVMDEFAASLNTLDDVIRCYSTSSEQHLWKDVFYNVIEVLRKASNTDSSSTEKYKAVLLKFFDQAIKFYAKLIEKYERLIAPRKFEEAFYWSRNDAPFNVTVGFTANEASSVIFEGKEKIILLSAQRHFLAIGDLFRYKSTLIDPVANIKLARCWYLKAVQANLHNGRSFNQLGVLASQSRNFLDMIFFYVQALSAKYPFGSARESLEIACNQIQQFVTSTNESAVSKPVNKLKDSKLNNTFIKCDGFSQKPLSQVEEVWILPEHVDGTKNVFFVEPEIMNRKLKDAKSQRNALLKILQLAGILVTNIGMENFTVYQKSVISDLSELICLENSIINSTNFLKIVVIFIFSSVHVKSGASDLSISLQREYALRTILDILCIVLEVVNKAMKKVDSERDILTIYKLNHSFNRVLPTLCVLSEWLLAPPKVIVDLLAAKDPSYFVASCSIFNRESGNFLAHFANVLNKIQTLINNDQLAKFSSKSAGSESDEFCMVLPELILSSSLHKIFKYPAPRFFVHKKFSINSILSDNEVLTLSCRLNVILMTAKSFTKILGNSEKSLVPHLSSLNKTIYDDGSVEFLFEPVTNDARDAAKIKPAVSNALFEVFVEKKLSISSAEDDELLKKRLMCEENTTQKQKFVVEVSPKYLIPDTNTFIDHLESIQRIVCSKRFIVLVPTTVIAELSSLSTDVAGRKASGIVPQKLLAILSPELGPKSRTRNIQMQYVIRQATATLDYLRKAAEERTPNLATVTSNGNIMSRVSFAQEMSDHDSMQTNDDRILAACIALCNKEDEAQTLRFTQQSDEDVFAIKRNVVFLTEDRALCIKAVSAKIPIRSALQFVKWSGV